MHERTCALYWSTNALKVEGKLVVTAKCVDGKLVCEWEELWETWEILHSSDELKILFGKCSKMLSGGGKGKGKANVSTQ